MKKLERKELQKMEKAELIELFLQMQDEFEQYQIEKVMEAFEKSSRSREEMMSFLEN